MRDETGERSRYEAHHAGPCPAGAKGCPPEPSVDDIVLGHPVPVPPSWIANARPVHHKLVAEMLRTLPDRRLTCIVGHGAHSTSWMACNEGPDGWGSWLIDYDPAKAASALRGSERRRRHPARRCAVALRRLADRIDPDENPAIDIRLQNAGHTVRHALKEAASAVTTALSRTSKPPRRYR